MKTYGGKVVYYKTREESQVQRMEILLFSGVWEQNAADGLKSHYCQF